MTMRSGRRVSRHVALSIFFLAVCAQVTWAQTSLKTIESPQGGKIVYGVVNGASTLAAAMGKVLRIVHSTCGERPQVGKPFKLRGTDAVGVHFTALDHPSGKMVAGLVIAAQTRPRHMEAAVVSDYASRFGSTANPMLRQLFSEWHPGSGSSAGEKSASAGDRHSASSAKLHTATASDNSASIGLANGWQLDPSSASSTMVLKGPNGALAVYNAMKGAVDPYNPQQVQAVRYGIYKGSGTVLYPYHPDLGSAYPEILQAWRRANNLPPARLQVEKIEPWKGGNTCVLVTGHIDADGQGMKKLIDDVCQTPPAQWGAYTITRNFNIMTDAQSEREQNTVIAMFMSVKVNQQVMNQQMQQKLAQKQQSDHQWRAWGQQQSNLIRAQGEAAQKRFADQQAAHDAQFERYRAQQDNNDRRNREWENNQDSQDRISQGFTNIIRDQTVVQDNDMYNNGQGTVGHGTAWNSTADALVKANPDRFEVVDSPNYWKGVDY